MKFFARWVGPIAVLLVLIAGTGYWFYWDWAAGRLAESVDRTAENWRQRGLTVAYDPVEVTGFPYRFEVNIANWQIAAPNRTTAPSAQSEGMLIYFQPWKMRHAIIETQGPVTTTWQQDGFQRSVVMTSDSNRASIVFDEQGRWERYNSAASNVRFTGDVMVQSAAKLMTHARQLEDLDGRPTLDLAVRGEQMKVDPARSPLGDTIDLLRVTVGFEPSPGSNSAADLERWRRDGGVMQVRTFEVMTGDLNVTGNGTFSLDDQHRPQGAATATIRGAEAFINAVGDAGKLSGGVRIGLQLAMKALEKRDSEGNPVVRVPITVQDGELGLMGFGLVPVQPLY